MKKILALLLLFIVACGGSSEETVVEDTTTTSIEDTTTTSLKQITTTTKLTTTTTTTTTTTLPPSTGVELDENGNDIFPAVVSISIDNPDISNGEIFSIQRLTNEEFIGEVGRTNPLRGNVIEITLQVVPGTNPIYGGGFQFYIFNDTNITWKLVGDCTYSKSQPDFNNKDNLIYAPTTLKLYCGDNDNGLTNFQYAGNSTGEVHLGTVYIGDNYGNVTTYNSPKFRNSNNVIIPEGFKTIKGETNNFYGTSGPVSDEYKSFFPLEPIYIITK